MGPERSVNESLPTRVVFIGVLEVKRTDHVFVLIERTAKLTMQLEGVEAEPNESLTIRWTLRHSVWLACSHLRPSPSCAPQPQPCREE